MIKVLTAAQMREVDRLTTERYGIPSIILMENAAHAVALVITEKLGGSVKGKRILLLCGKGNNGGDGAAIARLLWQAGADVIVCLLGKIAETRGDANVNFEIVQKLSKLERQVLLPEISFAELETKEEWNVYLDTHFGNDDPEIVVDAMFGTGLSKPLGGIFEEVARWIRGFNVEGVEQNILVISADIPSGLDADAPEWIGQSLRAHTTITFTAPKASNIIPPVSDFNGELVIADIGSPQELIDEQPSQLFLAEHSDVAEWFSKTEFSNDSYKNKRGHALIVSGSENYSGAAVLCGNSAIRSGVGLVTVATPRSSKESIAGRVVPEVMVRPVAETESGAVSEEAIPEVENFLENIDAIAIGAGLSASSESTGRFVEHFVENRRMPTILDADALTLMSPFEDVGPAGGPGSNNDVPLILTPHEGEFMRMLGTEDKEAITDRVASVREFSQKYNTILVLKGERVLIGEPGGKVVVNPTGNAGLGKAGNGDTLLGILAGFVAQAAKMEIDIFETVVAAVYTAGMAGDIAEKKYGKRVMSASDVRECLADAFEVLSGRDQNRFLDQRS
jgi:ADP-dependent NAD(P)H-hydrate dehydratase / NAD(P)H-hydrate epimerase